MEDFLMWVAAIVIMTLIAVVVIGGIAGIRLNPERGGHHTGFVTAVDQEGLFFPNYHVFVKTDNSSSQEDEYCVHRNNPELAKKLTELSKKKSRVTVHYEGVRGYGWSLCSGEEIKTVTEH